MIGREPSRLAGGRFDLIVVGGGILGAAVALEAAQRGLRPALLEARDFGGGATGNSFGIVHGGLRYLQTLDLGRHAESAREQRWFIHAFPDLVRVTPFLMPLDGWGARRPAVMAAAFGLDALLRRLSSPAAGRLDPPAGRVLDADATARLFPGAGRAGAAGGALWHDGVLAQPHRLVPEILRWASALGAACLNHTAVEEVVVAGGRVAGVRAREEVAGGELEVHAPIVLNCAGPAAPGLAGSGAQRLFDACLAFNVVLARRLPAEVGLAVRSPLPPRQTWFLRPLGEEMMLAGTAYAPRPAAGADPKPSAGELAAFLGALSAAVPSLALGPADVVRVHAGLLPAEAPGSAVPATRQIVLDHAAAGGPAGLFSLRCVKLTTARSLARRALDAAFGRRPVAAGAGPRPPAARIPTAAAFASLLREDPAAAAAEARRIAAEEAVVDVEDLLLRRTDWGLDPALAAEITTGLAGRLGVPVGTRAGPGGHALVTGAT